MRIFNIVLTEFAVKFLIFHDCLKNWLNTWIPFISKTYGTLKAVRSVQVEIIWSHLRMWLSCGQPGSYWLTVA